MNPKRKNPEPIITVERFYTQHAGTLGLKLLAGASGLRRRILEGAVSRPGLKLAGFRKYFAHHRIQVVGDGEIFYLKSLRRDLRLARLESLLQARIPCLIFARNLNPPRELLSLAEKYRIAVFKSPMITMDLINRATLVLDMEFSPQITQPGTMVDILGIGVLIKGESGVGKSECALSLLERGYSLVSDDVTRLHVLDGRELMGTSAELTRHLMEVRGLGIINVQQIFGVGAIRNEKRVDLVVTLKDWHDVRQMERVGSERKTYEILGISLPHVIIPIRPGRDIARLIEVAALDQKLKTMGHNAAQELNAQLIERMRVEPRP